MRRLMVVAVVLFGGVRVLAAERLAVPRLAAVLLDPHAPSHAKLRAAVALGKMGDDAVAAVPALLRQSRYDMDPVRTECLYALGHILGAPETGRLRSDGPLTDAFPSLAGYCAKWVEGIRGYETLYVARDLLRNPDRKYQEIAVRGLLQMRDGSLLVSDDGGKVIWRVSYKKS